MHPTHGQTEVRVTFDDSRDAFCPTCQYNLRSVTGASCPECGAAFQLANPHPPARHGLYLVGFGCAANLFLGGVYALPYMIRDFIDNNWQYYNIGSLVVFWAAVVLATPYVVLLVIFRNRIIHSRLGKRIAWAAPPILLALVQAAAGYITYLL